MDFQKESWSVSWVGPWSSCGSAPSFTNKEREAHSWFTTSLLPPVQAFPTAPSLESHLLEPEILTHVTYK